MLIMVPAGTGNVIVSPVSFPALRVVSSALYFGVTGAWDNRQRKSAAVPKSAQPQLTTGNILNVSYIVLRRYEFSHRDGYSDIAQGYVRHYPVKFRDVFESLRTQLAPGISNDVI